MDFQLRMAREAKFLSVYHKINEEVWTDLELRALGLNQDNLEPSYFMNEMLPNSTERRISQEMVKVWAGFETPDELTTRLNQIFDASC
ncbi:hypothetical protein D3C76_1299760 [compost metagenome]